MVRNPLKPLGPEPRRELLAICGGGFAGLFAAEVLARLEEDIGRSLGEVFDLIGGTSIGGLLALGLANGQTARAMSDLLAEVGPELFGYPRLPLFRPKHDGRSLTQALNDVLKDATMADLSGRVLIPTVDATAAEATVLGRAGQTVNATMRAVDAALATSAAPIFLAPHVHDRRQYIDGGLVANSPEGELALEAITRRNWSTDVTSMLVVGATRLNARTPGNLLGVQWGARNWLRKNRLLGLAMQAQMSLSRQTATALLRKPPVVIDAELNAEEQGLVGLDKATLKAAQVLRTLAATHYAAFKVARPDVLNRLKSHRRS